MQSKIQQAIDDYDENIKEFYYLISKDTFDGKCYHWLPSKFFLVFIILLLIAKMTGFADYLIYLDSGMYY